MSPGPLPLLTPAAAFGGPRPSLRLSNSLEGLTVLRKALTLMVTTYYMGRRQIKSGQGRDAGGTVQEGTKHSLPAVLSP